MQRLPGTDDFQTSLAWCTSQISAAAAAFTLGTVGRSAIAPMANTTEDRVRPALHLAKGIYYSQPETHWVRVRVD